jgi:L-glutamine-phosphate cytidylyltransferase
MRAIILAAGQGTRLGKLAIDRPKCLVEVCGKPLIEWQLETMRQQDITDITVITGHRADRLCDLEGCEIIKNPLYNLTNMVYSLFYARHLFDGKDDLLISYGDIVYAPHVLRMTTTPWAGKRQFEGINIAVDIDWRQYWEQRMEDPLSDAETLIYDADDLFKVVSLGQKPSSYEEIEGQYIGLIYIARNYTKLVKQAYESLERTMEGLQVVERLSMTQFLNWLILKDYTQVNGLPIIGGWAEIDTPEDIEIAEERMKLYAHSPVLVR